MIAKIRIIVLGIALMGMLGIASQVQAEADDDFGRPGIYLGTGFALGFDNFDGIPDSVDMGTAVGFDVWLGYRFIPNLAAEVEFEYLNGFEPDSSSVSLDGLAATANLKAYLLTDRFQPFALVGIGLADLYQSLGSRSSHTWDFAARFGGGIDVYLTESLALEAKASYVLGTGDIDGGDYVDLTIGAQFRF